MSETGTRFSNRNLVAAWINMEEHLIRFDAALSEALTSTTLPD